MPGGLEPGGPAGEEDPDPPRGQFGTSAFLLWILVLFAGGSCEGLAAPRLARGLFGTDFGGLSAEGLDVWSVSGILARVPGRPLAHHRDHTDKLVVKAEQVVKQICVDQLVAKAEDDGSNRISKDEEGDGPRSRFSRHVVRQKPLTPASFELAPRLPALHLTTYRARWL